MLFSFFIKGDQHHIRLGVVEAVNELAASIAVARSVKDKGYFRDKDIDFEMIDASKPCVLFEI